MRNRKGKEVEIKWVLGKSMWEQGSRWANAMRKDLGSLFQVQPSYKDPRNHLYGAPQI